MPRLSRFLLIALMLVLLPLRGWAGDVMAVNMALTAVAQAKISSTAQSAMSADCGMRAQSTGDDAAHCSNCDTCELCLAVLNLTIATWADQQQARQVEPLTLDAGFSNAASALNLKPPIF